MPTTTLSDVLTFINGSERTEADLTAISNSCHEREGVLRRARAATIREEDSVRLRDLSPKYLNGLTGKVAKGSISGNRCSVALDAESTEQLSRTGGRRFYIPAGTTEYTIYGVPLASVEKVTVGA